MIVGGGVLLLFFAVSQSRASCAAPANVIEAENCLPGNPRTDWDIFENADASIEGFVTEPSVNGGETVHFKINTPALVFRVDIYRIGYYGGLGGRRVATVGSGDPGPHTQPDCLTEPAGQLIDCGNWQESAMWVVPPDAVSGIYVAKLTRPDTGGVNHIVFVVRNDARRSDILFQPSDTTWQAYNGWHNVSLYIGTPRRGGRVSWYRPMLTRTPNSSNMWAHEYPMIRWLEANAYDVTYISGVDASRHGDLLLNHRAYLSVGHDEYWSKEQRAAVEKALSQGIHLGFFSGNEISWKIRWENSIDGSNTPFRTMVCYKDSTNLRPRDPAYPPLWTGLWRDPRFSPPGDGGRPENGLSGQISTVDKTRADPLIASAEDGRLRFWRNTSVAALPAGGSARFDSMVGYEWDEDLDNGFRPAGLFHLSKSIVNGVLVASDYIGNYQVGIATHTLTLYRHPSGALVFGAGTMQWGWGLDPNHDSSGPPAHVEIQQATVNLLADMGLQPATLASNLSRATASTDFTPPISQFNLPGTWPPGANATVTVSGTAADVGGGVVGAVEVSTDGGQTWHPAEGRAQWTYTWKATGRETTQALLSRAVDDSGNLEAGHGVTTSALLTLAGLDPGSANVGSQGITLHLTGTGFVPTSVVDWNGQARTTTFVNANQLAIILSATDFLSSTTASVHVRNPTAGQQSGDLVFHIFPGTGGTPPSGLIQDLSQFRVFPNPWTAHTDTGRMVTFDRLPLGTTIKLFTISAHWVRSLTATDGRATWDRTNDKGQSVGSGYYLYLIRDPQGDQARGKLALIQ